ncbi:calcium-binding protein, partial [Mesorhizobium sp. 1M-11]|uniref:beta strand repeat-containing protein n=1 Tax=Mesorhizobium sp. 1M-11 TaxID=1529006 RepID=UPI000AB5DD2B
MSDGNDTIIGTSVSEIIDAGAGDDVVKAGGGNDTITGGTGNDILQGEAGNDTYIYARGDGDDTIIEASLGGSSDKLVLQGINPSDITLIRNGNDVTLVIGESSPGAGDGGTILLKDNFEDYQDRGVDRIVFANGTTWTRASLRAAYLAQSSTAGNDVIVGFDAADTISGGLGNDLLDGGKGNDSYRYARGDGNDTIIEIASGGADDRLVLQNINPSSVTLVRNGNDVTLVIAESAPGSGDGGSILLKDNLEEYYDRGIDKILFADNAIWTRAMLRAALLSQSSTSGDDTIVGFDVADTINAGAGNDQISSGAGADILTGGAGDDVLRGGDGNDTYHYARGDGNDTIYEESGGGADDRLVLAGINPVDVSIVRIGGDLKLVIAETILGAGDGGSILLKVNLEEENGRGIDQIRFADGTIWSRADLRALYLAQASTVGSDTIVGFGGADIINGGGGNDVIDAGGGDDIITGGAGNDILFGGDGNDTYRYARGDGEDTIIETILGGSSDQLVLVGLHQSDVTVTRNGNDIILLIAESVVGAGDGGSITLKSNIDGHANIGVDTVKFADDSFWTKADLLANIAYVGGTLADDTVDGTNAADIIRAGKGNDVLRGGEGDDSYSYTRGDGNDTIVEIDGGGNNDRLLFTNINPNQATFARNGNDMTIFIPESSPGAGDSGSVLLKDSLVSGAGKGIEQVVFADGTIWTRADLRALFLTGTSGNDVLAGFSVDDTLRGWGGDDVLNGAGGNDAYVYARGDGDDTIIEGSEAGDDDRLVFSDINAASVSLVRNGNDVTIVIAESSPGAGDGGSVLLKDTLDDYYYRGVDKVVFADGTTWTRADLRLKLLAQASTAGNDTITGFNSNDVIIGGKGDDALTGAGGNDTYVYARGDGDDTIIEGSEAGDDDRLVFSDINSADVSLVRNGNDVTIVIAESSPGAGDGGSVLLKDTLDDYYYRGIDKVVFADGTTWARADLRDKLLTSTTADDTLVGFAGNDTFRYSRGDGNDTIIEGINAGDNDRLVFSNINAADVSLVRNAN